MRGGADSWDSASSERRRCKVTIKLDEQTAL
jgi:hypothetical protein